MEDFMTRYPKGEVCYRNVSTEIRRSSDDAKTTIIINTDDEDSYDTIIDPIGCRLQRYSSNPIVLINHNYSLIAGTSSVALRNGKLQAEMSDEDWDLEDAEIVKYYRKVKRQIMKAASVGFRWFDYKVEKRREKDIIRFTDWELLEWSFVTVGANPMALVENNRMFNELQKLQNELSLLKQSATFRSQVPSEEPPTVVPQNAPVHETVPPTQSPQHRSIGDYNSLLTQLTPVIRTEVRKILGKE